MAPEASSVASVLETSDLDGEYSSFRRPRKLMKESHTQYFFPRESLGRNFHYTSGPHWAWLHPRTW